MLSCISAVTGGIQDRCVPKPVQTCLPTQCLHQTSGRKSSSGTRPGTRFPATAGPSAACRSLGRGHRSSMAARSTFPATFLTLSGGLASALGSLPWNASLPACLTAFLHPTSRSARLPLRSHNLLSGTCWSHSCRLLNLHQTPCHIRFWRDQCARRKFQSVMAC